MAMINQGETKVIWLSECEMARLVEWVKPLNLSTEPGKAQGRRFQLHSTSVGIADIVEFVDDKQPGITYDLTDYDSV